MAFTNGTAVGIAGLYNAIVSFATTNGWTLTDTLNGYDKVLTSPGISGNRNLIYRVQAQPRYLEVSGVVGVFAVGDTITGGTSGDTATVIAVAPTVLTVIDNTGLFLAGEALTALPSGASATVAFRVQYDTILAPDAIQNAADHIVVRGYNYWNTGTNTGTNEYSRYGKFNLIHAQNNTPVSVYSVPSAATVAGSTSDTYAWQPPGNPNYFGGGGPIFDLVNSFYFFNIFDGRRSIGAPTGGAWAASGFRHVAYDLAEMNLQATKVVGTPITPVTGAFPYQNPLAVNRGAAAAFDKTTDNWLRYIDQRNYAPAAAQFFQRWDWNTNLWGPVATNAAYAPVPPAGDWTKLCWDGGDYIYMANGGNQEFGRYNIQTDTWDAPGTLANMPVNNNNGFSNPPFSRLWYVPKTAIAGATSDEVWAWLDSGSTIYRYDVNANTWSSLATPMSIFSFPCLTWDNERYVYLQGSGVTVAYRLDLQNIAGGWVSFASSAFNVGQYNNFVAFNQFTGNIRGLAQQPIAYWIVGDADTITVVTKVAGHYWWCQFGLAETFYSDFVATLTAPAVAGSPATVTVDDTSGLIAGQEALAFDPATGNYTKLTVYAITSPTTFTAFLTSGLATGVQVSTDHNCNLVTSDAHFATLACDGGGFASNGPELEPSYRVSPAAPPNWLPRGGATARDTWQTWPLVVYQNNPGLETYENRAKLRQVTVTRKVAGGPQSEDILKIGSNQYLVFYPENYQYTIDDQYLIVVGPI